MSSESLEATATGVGDLFTVKDRAGSSKNVRVNIGNDLRDSKQHDTQERTYGKGNDPVKGKGERQRQGRNQRPTLSRSMK